MYIVAYTIRNDEKVPIVTLGDLYYPYYTTIQVYMMSYVARYIQ
jgi:hypothetical protein